MAAKMIVREYGFIGYNDSLPSEYIPTQMLAEAINCFMRNGEIIKRTGYSIIGNDLGSYACQAIKGVRFVNGTREILAVFNGSIYKWTGSGSWTLLTGGSGVLATTGLVDIVVANNNVYFLDGVSTVPKYNGTTVTTVAAIPKGKYGRWFNNQFHIAGISGLTSTLKSSVVGNPEDFTSNTSSTLAINANDGDYISGLNTLDDNLVVFKTQSAFDVAGFEGSELTANNINERMSGFGAYSHFSIVNVGNDLLYVGFMGDKPVIRSLQRVREGVTLDAGVITEDIETTMSALNNAVLDKSCAMYDGRYAWFSFCNLTSTYNNIVITLDITTLNQKKKGYSKHTGIQASCFDQFSLSGTTVQKYFGESSLDAKAYVMDNSTSDNGQAIALTVKTRRFGGEAPEFWKKYEKLYLTFREAGHYPVLIEKSVDGFNFDTLKTIYTDGTGSIFDDIILDSTRLGETDIHKEGVEIPRSKNMYMQFRFSDSSTVSRITIRDWELYFYKLWAFRRG